MNHVRLIAFARHEIYEIVRIGVAQHVRLGWRGETHEVSGSHLECFVADLSDAPPLEEPEIEI